MKFSLASLTALYLRGFRLEKAIGIDPLESTEGATGPKDRPFPPKRQ